MALLLSGGRDRIQQLKWRAYVSRFENLLINNIFFLLKSDLSTATTPPAAKDINRNRFSVIKDESELKAKLDKLAINIATLGANKKGREKVMSRLISIVKVSLYEAPVFDILEGQLLLLTDKLGSAAAEIRGGGCIRDLKLRQLDQGTADLLTKIRDVFTNLFYEAIVQYIKLSAAWEEKKAILSDESFNEKLKEFNTPRLLQTMASLNAELNKYKPPTADNGKDDIINKLQQDLEEQKKINLEQEEKLSAVKEVDPKPLKRRMAQQLKDALNELENTGGDITTNSILDQMNFESETENVDINMREEDDKNEDDDMANWLSMKPSKGSIVTDTINGMVKKIDRLSDSKSITEENMMKMIQAGKFHIFT